MTPGFHEKIFLATPLPAAPPLAFAEADMTSAAAPVPCLFCSIVRGDTPAHRVHESDASVAFLDVRPVFVGHVLVVPRRHVVTLGDAPADLIGPFFADVLHVTRAVEAGMGADGSFVAMNNIVSQSVPHLHVHVVPRRRKDGLRGFFWPRQSYDGDAAMAEVAARIRSAVA
jgi:histidine triad (HIT) family protein